MTALSCELSVGGGIISGNVFLHKRPHMFAMMLHQTMLSSSSIWVCWGREALTSLWVILISFSFVSSCCNSVRN